MADEEEEIAKTSLKLDWTLYELFKGQCSNRVPISTAFNMLMRAVLRKEHPIPFPVPGDPFYEKTDLDLTDPQSIRLTIHVSKDESSRLNVLAKKSGQKNAEQYLQALVERETDLQKVVDARTMTEDEIEVDLLKRVLTIYRSGLAGVRDSLVAIINGLSDHVKEFTKQNTKRK